MDLQAMHLQPTDVLVPFFSIFFFTSMTYGNAARLNEENAQPSGDEKLEAQFLSSFSLLALPENFRQEDIGAPFDKHTYIYNLGFCFQTYAYK